MRASSQASLEAAADRWEPVLTDAGEDALAYGSELFAVADVLEGSASLRRALTDPGRAAAAKAELVANLLGQKVSEPVTDLLAGMARDRWSAEADLLEATSRLAIDSALASAAAAGELEQVEEEIFRASRVLAQNRELRLGLADSGRSVSARRELMASLFGDKVTAATALLLERSVGSSRHASLAAAMTEIGELAAQRRRRLVAVVTAAAPLSSAQVERLADILARSYGRQVQVHVAVDTGVIGGMRIEIGDDVVDATMLGRLDEARRRLAG